MGDISLFLSELPFDLHRLVVRIYLRTRRFGDADMRLAGLDEKENAVIAGLSRYQGNEVLAVELAITRHPGVDHAPVEGGEDFDPPRPVLRREPPFDGRQMRRAHMHEAPAL